VLFGKVRLELIPHDDYGYETGIVFGNDFDSRKFAYGNILGQISSPERDGSRYIRDVDSKLCGMLLNDMTIDTSESSCRACSKSPAFLKKISPNAYAVTLEDGTPVGLMEGRLPSNNR
jgi:hypothetical protein